MYKYKKAAVGGTFDILHLGHKRLLERTFELSSHVVIGITSDNFVSKLNKTTSNDYNLRVRNLENFVKFKFPNHKFEIFKLEDYFGPASFLYDIDIIVLTTENHHRLESLNRTRTLNGLSAIISEIVDIINAKDGYPISSTRIKKGEIDSSGNLLI
tara:strand:+ start:137 stop:604 length:468 start_codon:yes stop_codon:yes gene_type:complete